MEGLAAVIRNTTEFGDRLNSFSAELCERAQNDGVRLILYHIARYRKRLDITLKCLTGVEKTEFTDIPLSEQELTFLSERVFADTFVVSAAGKHDLLDTLIGVLDVLVSYYEWLLHRPLQERVKQFIEKLLALQVEEIELLKGLKTNQAL